MKIDDLFCIEPKIVNLSLGFKHFFYSNSHFGVEAVIPAWTAGIQRHGW